jgi:hypothetical protein
MLRGACGAFSLVHADPAARRTVLAVDRCGLRALHVWCGPDFIVFSSALRVLETLAMMPRHLDTRAVTEKVAIGYMLGDHSPYREILVLLPGEMIVCDHGSMKRTTYWRWDEIAPSSDSEQELGRLSYARFSAAVSRRRAGDTNCLAFLTGGMDTRTIVSELVRQGAGMHTLNGSFNREMDQLLGRMFADAIGSEHLDVPEAIADPAYPLDIALAWRQVLQRHRTPPDRPFFVWAGVGGSVGIGHYHFSQKLADAARRSDAEGIDAFVRQESMAIPLRILKRSQQEGLHDTVQAGLAAETERLAFADRARALHMAVVLNDTRRAFHTNLEDLDLHRLESSIPLADARLLEVFVSAPFEWCLGHRLYLSMIAPLAPIFERTPWQTYAGHIPCPYPLPDGALGQWSPEQMARRRRRRWRRSLAQGWRSLLAAGTHSVVRRSTLAAALAAHTFGLRDTEYHLIAAEQYIRAERHYRD